LLLCFSTFPVKASETGKTSFFGVLSDGLYLEGGVQYYQVPDMFAEYLEADPGFRAGLGFEWRHIRLAATSGYSRLRGNTPLVSDIQIIPLFGKAGYQFALPAGFYILPEAGAGNIYTTVGHYWTALDYLMENFTVSSERSFTATASLRAGWDVPGNFLSLYAGGGADLIIETDGPIAMPFIEAGISVKPLMITRLFPKKKAPVALPTPVAPAPPPVPEIAAPVERQWGGGLLWFEPDTDVPLEGWLAVLEAAAGELRRDEKARLTIRGHSAPVGDVASQLEVSRLRSEFCAEYLREAGIGGDRLTVEWFGGERPVTWWDENKYPRPLKSFRCAEIIVDGGGSDGGGGGTGGLLPEERAVRFHSAVYFSPDAAEFPAEYRSVLEAAARELARDDGSRLILRGCAAPVGSVESRLELARLRAEFCKAWFLNFFDFFDFFDTAIDESRIILEYEAPPWNGKKDDPLLFRTYRRVEIIVELAMRNEE
jgi:outer membrane protein OmpA-like peptidoglycan-associated protein